MGIIKWGLQAGRSAYADQPKEILMAQGLSNEVLAVPAVCKGKQTPQVITDGSVFNVAANQAALLIENGKVHDFVIGDSAENTGQFVYDTSLEPSLLTGGRAEWNNVWEMVKNRFSFGGHSPNTMHLVYINLKEITHNPVGVGRIPFIDTYLSTRLMLSAHGYYTFRISNPVVFYENLLMDPTRTYTREEITGQLKEEMKPRIQAALAAIAPLCTSGYQDIYLHDREIAESLSQALGKEWLEARGIELLSVALTPELSMEDAQRIMELENARTLSNADMALGSMVNAQNRAVQNAASNSSGAFSGVMGMNMVSGGSLSASDLLAQKLAAAPVQNSTPDVSAGEWNCPNCHQKNSGKFCTACGTPKPSGAAFCPECGTPAAPGAKFCSNCGHKLS